MTAQLAREGLEPKPGDLEEFAKIIELYVDNLKTLHSVNLGAEELAPVFRPGVDEEVRLRKDLSLVRDDNLSGYPLLLSFRSANPSCFFIKNIREKKGGFAMAVAEKPLYYLSIHEAQQLIQKRQLSPVELTQAVLDRIEAVDGKVACLYQSHGRQRHGGGARGRGGNFAGSAGAVRCTAFLLP